MSRESRILFIERYGIGDGVLSTPAIEGLRQASPDAEITTFTTSGVAELRRPCPHINRIVESEAQPGVNLGAFDVIVDLTGKLSTARLSRALGAPVRIGCPWWITRLLARRYYTHIVRPGPGAHVCTHKCDLAAVAGATQFPASPRLWLTDDDRQEAAAWLRSAGLENAAQIVALNPSGHSRGRAWPAAGFVAVCDAIGAIAGARAVLIGARDDLPRAQAIAAAAAHKPAIAAGALKLRQTAALMSHCSAIVTGDTGPMHLAAAAGVRVVALFGRSDPSWSGPAGLGHIVLTAGMGCSPCRGTPHSRYRVCLNGYSCMGRITPEQVIAALRQTLTHSKGIPSR